jgi:hypothetical protein
MAQGDPNFSSLNLDKGTWPFNRNTGSVEMPPAKFDSVSNNVDW